MLSNEEWKNKLYGVYPMYRGAAVNWTGFAHITGDYHNAKTLGLIGDIEPPYNLDLAEAIEAQSYQVNE